jgi:hypothetical protein
MLSVLLWRAGRAYQIDLGNFLINLAFPAIVQIPIAKSGALRLDVALIGSGHPERFLSSIGLHDK